MTSRTKVIVTILLLVFLGGLGIADFYLSKGVQIADNTTIPSGSGSSIGNSSIPAGGVRPQNGPEVAGAIAAQGFTTTDYNDLSFLVQIAGSGAEVNALAILKDGDRVGSVTWIESPKVKNYFIALKEALLNAFSPQMTDLKDQTLQGSNVPVRNYLTFMDPSLSAERLVFIRVRGRLYEFHITSGKEDIMNALIDTMTTK